MTRTTTSASTSSAEPAEDQRIAYEALLPRIRAVSADSLPPINVDCVGAAQRVLGCLPKIGALVVPDGSPRLAGLERAHLADLGQLARALLWAQRLLESADVPAEPIDELVKQVVAARDQLVADATALAKRKVISTRVLDGLKGGPGFRNQLDDLMNLVAQLGQHEAEVIAHSAIRAGDLDRLRLLGSQLDAALGRRAELPRVAGEPADLRQRAYALLERAYEETRRAVTFVRWYEGDADAVAPSLHAQRGPRRSGDAESAPSTEAPAAPAPTREPPVPPGHPGGDPFPGASS